eukprot:SAG31_NODE_1953_length_6829_cov_6.548886_2_plen_433_part_00
MHATQVPGMKRLVIMVLPTCDGLPEQSRINAAVPSPSTHEIRQIKMSDPVSVLGQHWQRTAGLASATVKLEVGPPPPSAFRLSASDVVLCLLQVTGLGTGVWKLAPSDNSASSGTTSEHNGRGGAENGIVLKRLNEPPEPKERATLEARLMQHLRAVGVPVALPLAADSGEFVVRHNAEGCWYKVAEFVASDNRVQDDGDSPAGQVRPDELGDADLFHNFGAAIGRCHKGLASFPRNATIPSWLPTDKPCKFVKETALPALAEQPAGSAAAAVAVAVSTGKPAAALSMAAECYAKNLQLVHRDLHAGNVLTIDGNVSAIIDWDHLCWGSPTFDLAYFSNQLGKWVALESDAQTLAQWEKSVAFLLAGYRSVLSTSDVGDLAEFPGLMLAAPISFAGWIVLDCPELGPEPDLALAAHIANHFERLEKMWVQST